MNTNLATRVGRIISGGFHMLVDALEGAAPEAVMEQAIREVDEVEGEVRTELGRIVAAKHLASKRLMEENRRHEALAEQIADAVENGRDDLAEAGIAQQMDIEAQIPVLERTVQDNATQESELEGYLAALDAKRREMREELRQFRETQRQQAQTAGGVEAGAPAGSGHSQADAKIRAAEGAFDRVMERATGVPGGVKPGMGNAKQLAELGQLSRQNRIKERLAALKGKTVDND